MWLVVVAYLQSVALIGLLLGGAALVAWTLGKTIDHDWGSGRRAIRRRERQRLARAEAQIGTLMKDATYELRRYSYLTSLDPVRRARYIRRESKQENRVEPSWKMLAYWVALTLFAYYFGQWVAELQNPFEWYNHYMGEVPAGMLAIGWLSYYLLWLVHLGADVWRRRQAWNSYRTVQLELAERRELA